VDDSGRSNDRPCSSYHGSVGDYDEREELRRDIARLKLTSLMAGELRLRADLYKAHWG
jgi:hypothetical protein